LYQKDTKSGENFVKVCSSEELRMKRKRKDKNEEIQNE
jgi:hypothetical protein